MAIDEVEMEIITGFISTWMWRIISIIFLSFSILFFAMNSNYANVYAVMWISFLALFVISQFMAWKRKAEGESEDA